VLTADLNKLRSQSKVFRAITDAVAPEKKGFYRYSPIYNRAGTLVHIAGVGYLVLTPWTLAQTKMPEGQYPVWLKNVYLNPENMSYLAITENIDLDNTQSYVGKLQNYEPEVILPTPSFSFSRQACFLLLLFLCAVCF